VLALVLALLSGCAVEAVRQPQALRQQQRSMEAERRIALPLEEVEYALTVQRAVYDVTDDIFAALRQAKLQHLQKYGSNPELYRRLDELTVILWGLDGGEMAEAECYIRGFQFGTAHHDQCVYEVKMGGGREQQRASEAVVPRVSQPQDAPERAPIQEQVARGSKVYSAEECIGPIIMGKCHGSILPNGGYHPTCHGAWLAGRCTGPMF
jgi:hypothetical protein